MQTFLPFPGFWASAAALDTRRLGRQRVEGLQLLHGLTRRTCAVTPSGLVVVPFTATGHVHHPASKMWRGYAPALACYVQNVCRYWTTVHGYADTVAARVALIVPGVGAASEVELPPWVGDERVHRSHRSNLIRKDPGHYAGRLGWTDPPSLAYVWPTHRRPDRTAGEGVTR